MIKTKRRFLAIIAAFAMLFSMPVFASSGLPVGNNAEIIGTGRATNGGVFYITLIVTSTEDNIEEAMINHNMGDVTYEEPVVAIANAETANRTTATIHVSIKQTTEEQIIIFTVINTDGNSSTAEPLTITIPAWECVDGHNFVDIEVASAATCIAAGVMNTKCDREFCDETSTRVIEIDPSAHTPSDTGNCNSDQICVFCNKILAEATGHTIGAEDNRCAKCGEIVSGEEKNMTGAIISFILGMGLVAIILFAFKLLFKKFLKIKNNTRDQKPGGNMQQSTNNIPTRDFTNKFKTGVTHEEIFMQYPAMNCDIYLPYRIKDAWIYHIMTNKKYASEYNENWNGNTWNYNANFHGVVNKINNVYIKFQDNRSTSTNKIIKSTLIFTITYTFHTNIGIYECEYIEHRANDANYSFIKSNFPNIFKSNYVTTPQGYSDSTFMNNASGQRRTESKNQTQSAKPKPPSQNKTAPSIGNSIGTNKSPLSTPTKKPSIERDNQTILDIVNEPPIPSITVDKFMAKFNNYKVYPAVYNVTNSNWNLLDMNCKDTSKSFVIVPPSIMNYESGAAFIVPSPIDPFVADDHAYNHYGTGRSYEIKELTVGKIISGSYFQYEGQKGNLEKK